MVSRFLSNDETTEAIRRARKRNIFLQDLKHYLAVERIKQLKDHTLTITMHMCENECLYDHEEFEQEMHELKLDFQFLTEQYIMRSLQI